MQNSIQDEQNINDKKHTSYKMGSMPIPKLLLVMSLPAMLSMLVQALYNIMDTVYVGMFYSGLGDTEYIAATQALSVAFPIQLIITAVGLGIGIGANAIISKKLGEGNRPDASKAANTAILMAFAALIIMSVIGIFATKPFVEIVADASGEGGLVIQYGVDYLFVVTVFSAGMILELTGSRILQATGNMKIPMIAQMVGAVINIALDPLFLFGFQLGVRGAAIATVISQFCSAGITYTVILFIQKEVKISIFKNKYSIRDILNNMNVGIPAFFLNAVGALTYISLLRIIKGYALGGIVQQVLGLYFKLNSLIFMPIFGLMQGLLPILGYSYGAQNKERYKAALKLSTMLSLGILLIGLLLFETAPELLLSLFSAGSSTLEIGRSAMRIIAISFPFAAIGINLINAYQSLQCGVRSLIMSLFRQLGIIVPFAAIFANFGAWGIWASYPVSEFLTTLIFFPQIFYVINKKFKQDGEKHNANLPNSSEPLDSEISAIAPTVEAEQY